MEAERSSARSSPARGVALIATAVIIGLFIVRNGFESVSSVDEAQGVEAVGDAAAPPPDGGSGGGGAGGGGGAASTTTTAPPRAPAEVTVLVANASGVNGAAATLSTEIGALGYKTLPGTNTASQNSSSVHFVSGYRQEAAALATAINVPADAVAPMSQPPPVDLGAAQILVVLGPDLANG